MMEARFRPLIPGIAFRTGWSSSAFLLYAGAYVIVGSVVSLLVALGGEGYGQLALVGWSAFAFLVLAFIALGLSRAGEDVPAGLFAVLALIVFGFWVGFTESWLDLWPQDTESFVPEDFEIGIPLLSILVVAAGLLAIRVFAFPLLMLPIAVTAWYGLAYVVISALPGSQGNDAQALVALLVGLGLVVAGIVLDRSARPAYALWLHVVGGVAVMGGMIALRDEAWKWALVALVSVGFVLVGEALRRSSYTVVGAFGFMTAGAYFVEKWFAAPPEFLSFPFSVFFFAFSFEEESRWSGGLATAFLGAVLFLGGIALARGWRPRRRSAAP
jgi:hypothetical protein